MKKLLLGVLIGVSGLAFYACNKNNNNLGTDTLKTSAKELVATDAKVDNIVETSSYESDIFSLGSGSITTYSAGLKSAELFGDMMGGDRFRNMFEHFPNFKMHYMNGIIPNLTVTTTNGDYPKTMVIDYGDSLVLNNGHVLKGKITIVISAAPFVSGSTRTITYDSFCNDSTCISGTSVKTRTKDPQIKFSENTDLTVTLANGTTIHRVEEHVRTWVSGSDTEFTPADDVIELTGQVIVSDSKGNSYSKIITTPLVKTGDCKFITKGVIEYKNSTGKFATIDYGDGTCDNKATRTTQDGTSEITLGRMGR